MDKAKELKGITRVTLTRKTPTSDFLYKFCKEIHKKQVQNHEKKLTKEDFNTACNKITGKYAKIIDGNVSVGYVKIEYWKGAKPKKK